MKNFVYLFVILIMIAGISACSSEEEAIEAGSICTVQDTASQYRLAKVLVINDEMVHLMLFKKRYEQRPETIGPDDLELGEPADTEGDTVGNIHIALSRAEFINWHPEVIAFEKVVEEDLEGYKLWKDQKPGKP